jgi:YD repeat-containing protein
LDIGRYGDSGGGDYFSGSIDEVEVSNTVRSSDWITTAYNNQSSASSFYSIGGPNPPTIAGLSPASGTVGTVVTITGTRFGSTQGTSTVTFDGISSSPTSWSDTSIVVPVPTGAASGNVLVTVSGAASNGAWFAVPSTWPNHYGFQRAITISHTKVPNTDRANFPVLISGTYAYLATTANGGNVTSANGYDIVFTSDAAGSNVIPFEQETYSASTGAVNYWVQVPTVSHTTDTTIYMFYGNSAVTTDQSNKNGVWDSNYKGVWHLDQTPSGSGSILDSTSNGYNGTPASSGISLSSTGIAGGSLNFNGVSSSNGVSFSSSTPGGPPITASIWIKTTGLNSTAQSQIMAKFQWSSTGWGIYDDGQYDANVFLRPYPNYNNIVDIPRSDINNGAWHYLVGTIDSSNTLRFYLDGALFGSTTTSSVTADTADSLVIGAFGGNAGGGLLTEGRVSNTVRSADWIATEYNNLSSPTTFYSVSSVADIGGPSISSVSPTTGTAGTSVSIAGAGFGSSQGSSTVKFNGTSATPSSWSSTSIAAPVPSGATTGNLVVTVSGMASNAASFTVTGTLSGTVTNQSGGTAISGASVQVLQNGSAIATTTTASNGTYTIASLATGEYDVQFSAAGFGSVLQPAVALSATGATLNQALGTAGTISGQITQSNGTTAISGATINALQTSEIVGTTTSNGSGNYSISNLSAGSYEVEVSASGYVNQGLTGVSVTSGNTTTENFSLNAVGTQPISYVYDQLGRLTAAIDQAGNVAGYAYDSVGNILSISRGSAQQLSIISFSPNSGSVGSTVTVYGTAFNTTPSLNTVKFNGTTATVTAATATSLVVSVPSGATTGTVSVTTSAGTATSTPSFTVTTAGAGQPTITSFSPSIGTPGTSVSITGTNFDTTTANDKVKFNVGPSIPSTATTTSLSVSVPGPGTSGHLVVATPAGTVSSTSDFFVPPSPFTASSVGYTSRVSLGSGQTVTISTGGQIGLLVFDETAGHRASLLTSSNTMTSTGGATTISINNPSGTSLASQSVTTSAPFIAAQNVSVTGTYTVVIQPASSATGSITVTVYDVPTDVAGSITVGGSSVSITTTTPGQGGTLTFSGTSGQQVTVHATSNTISNVTVSLVNPDGSLVTSQTSSSSSFNLTSSTLAETGTFTIKVSASQGNTGGITIQLTSP